MELSLDKSIKEELKELAQIYMTEFSKPPYKEDWTIEKAVEKMEFFLEFYDLFTVKVDGKLVGFICINPKFMCPGEVAFGEEVAIKEEFQGKGVGTWVFGEIFKIYKEKGFKRVMGIADVNAKVFKLYKKLGILPSKENVLIEKEL
jgi:aminoglycoside 6'-N-acetyltransferase I